MQPIHELLNRIRWDPAYRDSKFEIGYYDRVRKQIIRISFQAMLFAKNDHFGFDLIDDEGEVHQIPFHRIKRVYRDEKLIWRREY